MVDGKRRLRMHYVTQTGVNPPTFTFFVNHSDSGQRHLPALRGNRMRSTFDFAGTPIRLFFLGRRSKAMHNPILLDRHLRRGLVLYRSDSRLAWILGTRVQPHRHSQAGSGNIGTTNGACVAGPCRGTHAAARLPEGRRLRPYRPSAHRERGLWLSAEHYGPGAAGD